MFVEGAKLTSVVISQSAPTNFRREEIRLPGLDEEQQRSLREKARQDAQKLYPGLQPLRSSPSGHFASPTDTLPSYEDFTTPRPSPAIPSPGLRESRLMEGIKRHSRKLSNSLTDRLGGLGSGGFGGADGLGLGREDSKYEMRALMEPSRSRVVSPLPGPKMSGESYGSSESERERAVKAVGTGVKI
ncbi:uncharacterized protein LTR77_009049 [Saxophila tyrrhenica]|uniref:Uncharacterized protein n=1 Tax=Saxophila tyrrhenica TaxID=1690608 RepID=A0AAV9NZS5_9PEZI|nr:hypothetical protein LTR77_009049 [Saxophila tyrrhenica]